MAETSTQIIREAPEIEAAKLGLLQSAKQLADKKIDLPPYLVAQMSGMQITALDLAKAGMESYAPYLEEAGYTLGDAQKTIDAVSDDASRYQNQARDMITDAAGGIQGQVDSAQGGIANAVNYGGAATDRATTGLATAADRARAEALAGQNALGAASGQIPGVLDTAQQGTNTALLQSGQAVQDASDRSLGTTLGESLAESTNAARTGTTQAGNNALNAAGQAQLGLNSAAQGALSGRGIAGQAGAGTAGAIDAARNAAAGGAGALAQAGLSGAGIAADAGLGARLGAAQTGSDIAASTEAARAAAQAAGTGGIGAYEAAANRTQGAVQGARGITNTAAQALQEAGAFGTQTAQQGIAGLAGTTGAYDPSNAGST